jgi:ornithine carbamoyltransferase
MSFVHTAPARYQLPATFLNSIRESVPGAQLKVVVDPEVGVRNADVVVTDTWTSMGQEAEKDERLKTFTPYQVNPALMALAKPGALFMHCLPAHRGEEVTASVMDSPISVVFDQAENRLHAQKAIMLTLMGKNQKHG